jgi:hypothetical protein
VWQTVHVGDSVCNSVVAVCHCRAVCGRLCVWGAVLDASATALCYGWCVNPAIRELMFAIVSALLSLECVCVLPTAAVH